MHKYLMRFRVFNMLPMLNIEGPRSFKKGEWNPLSPRPTQVRRRPMQLKPNATKPCLLTISNLKYLHVYRKALPALLPGLSKLFWYLLACNNIVTRFDICWALTYTVWAQTFLNGDWCSSLMCKVPLVFMNIHISIHLSTEIKNIFPVQDLVWLRCWLFWFGLPCRWGTWPWPSWPYWRPPQPWLRTPGPDMTKWYQAQTLTLMYSVWRESGRRPGLSWDKTFHQAGINIYWGPTIRTEI